jgi:hypothetical protein
MRIIKILVIAVLSVATLGACNKELDELLVNPNSPDPSVADADLFLTQMELSFAAFFNNASNFGGQTTRMYNMGATTYRNAYSPESFDGIWTNAYAGVMKHANALIPIAEQQKKYVNVGMAKVLKAYTMMTLVDMFGDIPYTEANLGADNTNPAVESGKDVYAKAITLLDEAVAALSLTPGSYPASQDLFFGASNSAGRDRWRKTAKLLKLRALNQTRLVNTGAAAAINALLADADVAGATAADDFEFKYSSKQTNPNSRHPRYNANYTSNGTAGDYMSIYYMWTLAAEKGTGNSSDPRLRYYFYRQVNNYAGVTADNLPCYYSSLPPPAHYTPGMPFCFIAQGYWGRDHADGSGIPPDGNLRATVGIYPAGGDFDANQAKPVSLNTGGQGAGILPIWQSSFTDFLKAESSLKLGTTGDARAFLKSGIEKSLAKVIGFPATVAVVPNPTYVPDATRQSDYVNKVLTAYDAAASADDKLNIVIKEWYIASWGNGLDVFNTYRRTGMPKNIQFTLSPNPGDFTRSMVYPASYVNLNNTAQQKAGPAVQVFWDNNPAGFIK